MNDEKASNWKQLWELSIVLLGVYFAAYTIAKDYVENSKNTIDALYVSLIYWLTLMVLLFAGTVIIVYILSPIGRWIWHKLKILKKSASS